MSREHGDPGLDRARKDADRPCPGADLILVVVRDSGRRPEHLVLRPDDLRELLPGTVTHELGKADAHERERRRVRVCHAKVLIQCDESELHLLEGFGCDIPEGLEARIRPSSLRGPIGLHESSDRSLGRLVEARARRIRGCRHAGGGDAGPFKRRSIVLDRPRA